MKAPSAVYARNLGYLLDCVLLLDSLDLELDLGEGFGNLGRDHVVEVLDGSLAGVANSDFVDFLRVGPVQHRDSLGFDDADAAVLLRLVVVHLHRAAHRNNGQRQKDQLHREDIN